MSVAQRKAAARRIKQRYPAPRVRQGAIAVVKGKKIKG
jgi:hypothetical protein